MTTALARTAVLASGLVLAGCNGTLEDIAPKAERDLPTAIVNTMKAKGMSPSSPIMVRIFKEEGELEVWKQKDNGRYDLVTSYEICKWSGKLGPKFVEGDRQAPEGFYTVRPGQMNPKSDYHLAFNIGYPNVFDQSHDRTGQHLMVHGACSSAGCYSMTDEQVEQIYAFARDAFRGGQKAFQVQAFPFRMTPENMARYRDDPNYEFWRMLKEGYDHFEITKVPPRVDVCEKRYVFNHTTESDDRFQAAGACPPAKQPEALQTAYRNHKARYDAAYAEVVDEKSKSDPAPAIAGMKEAVLVADWSQRRARGEQVTPEPPSLDAPSVADATSDDDESSGATSGTASAYVATDAPRAESAEAGDAPAPTPNPASTGEDDTAAPENEGSRLARLWNMFSE